MKKFLFVNLNSQFTKTTKIKIIVLVNSFFKSLCENHYYDYLLNFLQSMGIAHYEKLILNLCLIYCLISFLKTFIKNLSLILLTITMTVYLNIYKK